jgi:hypothetical protein
LESTAVLEAFGSSVGGAAAGALFGAVGLETRRFLLLMIPLPIATGMTDFEVDGRTAVFSGSILRCGVSAFNPVKTLQCRKHIARRLEGRM